MGDDLEPAVHHGTRRRSPKIPRPEAAPRPPGGVELTLSPTPARPGRDAEGAGPGGALPVALVASLFAHGIVVLLALVALSSFRAARAGAAAEVQPVDRWTGITAELPGHGGEYDVELFAPAVAAGPPAVAREPAPVAAGAEPVPPVPAPPARVPPVAAPRRPAPPPGAGAPPARAPPAQGPTPPGQGPAPPRRREPKPTTTASAAPATASAPDARRRTAKGAPAKPVTASSGAPGADGPAAAGSRAGAAPGSGGSFGAEGEASVRDLGRAFTRAIPPASDSDPAWAALPTGDAGALEVAIDVDATGHITGWRPLDEHPSKHLSSLVKRTVLLLKQGTFALRGGDVGAGAQVLRLGATVSDVEVPADHPGGSFGLKYAYAGGKGTAAFTQMSGRHVEITVKLLRVEAAAPDR